MEKIQIFTVGNKMLDREREDRGYLLIKEFPRVDCPLYKLQPPTTS
jgi:hypothetical protein